MTRLSIGEFAAATGLTAKALRLYDGMGVVRPAAVDEGTGYRWYEPGQVADARLVAQLRLVGMPLARIQEVVRLDPEFRAAELRSWWRQIEAEHLARRARLALLVASTGEEQMMRIDQEIHPKVAVRSGRGQRELQLDVGHEGRRVYAVADGFGSDPALPKAVATALQAQGEPPIDTFDPLDFLDAAVARVAAAVSPYADAGTTLTMLLVGADRAAIAHVGDTRAHLVRDGSLERLTRDHSFVQSLVEEGRLTPEEARVEEDRALITRALAAPLPAESDVAIVAARPGDRFVLTTDGVHAVLPAQELAGLLTRAVDPESVVAAVEAAVGEHGAPDNYCIVVVDLPAL